MADQSPAAFEKEQQNAQSAIKRVIGVVSGKGGVGKSMVTSLLSVYAQRTGAKVGLLDADITGPSIPKMFGVTKKQLTGENNLMYPVESEHGVKIMSINLLLENETDPVLWRGPVVGSAIKQFWSEVAWGEIDYLFVDMPPGTGDVALTVFQSLPVDGLIIVTSPQDLVSMIVAKAVKMADTMGVPVLGLVENMSYLACPHCDERIEVFGESHTQEIARGYRLPLLGEIPIDPKMAKLADEGKIEEVKDGLLDEAIKEIFTVEANDVSLGEKPAPAQDDAGAQNPGCGPVS
ncbi:MAG: Mrp/NBP35 family ATP-binding protein [Coriobacteriia bacterium]|nr:Mrp/NBP35 family ATP-binding protein [Coriobacteriia bacterium]